MNARSRIKFTVLMAVTLATLATTGCRSGGGVVQVPQPAATPPPVITPGTTTITSVPGVTPPPTIIPGTTTGTTSTAVTPGTTLAQPIYPLPQPVPGPIVIARNVLVVKRVVIRKTVIRNGHTDRWHAGCTWPHRKCWCR